MKGAAFFSGGKDSVYAIMKAKECGIPVDVLIFSVYDFPRPSPHFVNFKIVESIAQEMGLPLVVNRMKKGEEVKRTSDLLEELGVSHIVTGDIFAAHLQWFSGICAPLQISYHTPLLLDGTKDSRAVILDELALGIRPLLVHVDGSRLPKEYLGKVIDRRLIERISKTSDPCGENGEYHTLAIGFPMMGRSIIVEDSEQFSIGFHHYLKINRFSMK